MRVDLGDKQCYLSTPDSPFKLICPSSLDQSDTLDVFFQLVSFLERCCDAEQVTIELWHIFHILHAVRNPCFILLDHSSLLVSDKFCLESLAIPKHNARASLDLFLFIFLLLQKILWLKEQRIHNQNHLS